MHTVFEVKGMHCEACENRIKTTLQTFSTITAIEVDHRRDRVAIEHQDANIEAVGTAIASLGFTVSQG